MSVLERIAAHKREEVAAAKRDTPSAVLEEKARHAPRPRGFHIALSKARALGRMGLIGELKKASPSKGLIRADFDPPELARSYERGGATCLSVLTDARFFQGAPQYVMLAREVTTLPVLRKDFILDPYQVVESRALGADSVLLIMSLLDDAAAAALLQSVRYWGMDALVEVHDEAELNRALMLGAEIIGINNRNLQTFETHIETSIQLARLIPADRLVIAESGLTTPADLRELARVNITTFLIGESLMRAPDVEAATRALLQGVGA